MSAVDAIGLFHKGIALVKVVVLEKIFFQPLSLRLTWKMCISDLELVSPPTMNTRMLLYISMGSLLVNAVGS